MLSALPISAAQAKKEQEEIPTVSTTLPWITSVSRFLVGTTINIEPLNTWAPNGTLKRSRARTMDTVIALDPKDASSVGMSADDPRLHMLYTNFPVPDIKRGSAAFDPSVLPFLSQRLLVVISEIAPSNYPFYQRRLAEFQSRLESTLEVGRSLIGEEHVLDLTGACGPWVRGAVAQAVRPPDDLWRAWMGSTRIGELRAALAEAKSRGMIAVIDAWTPPAIRSIVLNEQGAVDIPVPQQSEDDIFSYLQDIFLIISKRR